MKFNFIMILASILFASAVHGASAQSSADISAIKGSEAFTELSMLSESELNKRAQKSIKGSDEFKAIELILKTRLGTVDTLFKDGGAGEGDAAAGTEGAAVDTAEMGDDPSLVDYGDGGLLPTTPTESSGELFGINKDFKAAVDNSLQAMQIEALSNPDGSLNTKIATQALANSNLTSSKVEYLITKARSDSSSAFEKSSANSQLQKALGFNRPLTNDELRDLEYDSSISVEIQRSINPSLGKVYLAAAGTGTMTDGGSGGMGLVRPTSTDPKRDQQLKEMHDIYSKELVDSKAQWAKYESDKANGKCGGTFQSKCREPFVDKPSDVYDKAMAAFKNVGTSAWANTPNITKSQQPTSGGAYSNSGTKNLTPQGSTIGAKYTNKEEFCRYMGNNRAPSEIEMHRFINDCT